MLRSLPINNHTKFPTNNLIKVDPGLALLCRGFCFGAIDACGKIGRGKYKAQGGLQEERRRERDLCGGELTEETFFLLSPRWHVVYFLFNSHVMTTVANYSSASK